MEEVSIPIKGSLIKHTCSWREFEKPEYIGGELLRYSKTIITDVSLATKQCEVK